MHATKSAKSESFARRTPEFDLAVLGGRYDFAVIILEYELVDPIGVRLVLALLECE